VVTHVAGKSFRENGWAAGPRGGEWRVWGREPCIDIDMEGWAFLKTMDGSGCVG